MDFYSRMIAFLKVALPLLALGILATLFLLSRGINFEAVIPFAEKEIASRMRDQQITAPYFSGTTPSGDEIMVNATLARPGGPDTPAQAKDVSARLRRADGTGMTLGSDLASVDGRADMATFSGNVRITTTSGLIVTTEELHTALAGISGSTPGTVAATGPMGELTAGRLEFGAKNGNGPLHMLFKDGVKLIYRPEKMEN